MKTLTKSRFKLGLECANKLFYTRKKEYANQKQADPFLMALAKGGFQVEELARLHFPGGVLLEGNDGDYQFLHNETQKQLQKENVTLYEPAFLVGNLFIRVDVLVKKGNKIELIEVKAKSINPINPGKTDYKKESKKIPSTWKPYFFDLAFQKHVVQSALPTAEVTAFFMLADKSKKASINGLNQLFRVTDKGNKRTGVITNVKSLDETGDSVLIKDNVDELINLILIGEIKYGDLTFDEALRNLEHWYITDTYANWPTSKTPCKNCEFKSTDDNLKSGFEACFKKQWNLSPQELKQPTILDIWNFRDTSLFDEKKLFMKDLTEDDLKVEVKPDVITSTERRWIQVEKAVGNDTSIHIEKDGLKQEMESWVYPLHFIDFETSNSPLPFLKGMKPYEQVSFQFSHHMVYEDETVEHKTEFISNEAGKFPNFDFLRALKSALGNDNGSIFKYSNHENSILNAIFDQLTNSSEEDKEELKDFIREISHAKKDRVEKWCGDRDMIDLCEVVKKFYYNPLMGGSNSIKVVLPAVISSSDYIQKNYSKGLAHAKTSSLNFDKDHVWLVKEDEIYVNPYKQLPLVFDGYTDDNLEEMIGEMDDISNGGAALTAYGKLQYTDMTEMERKAITAALRKYCELDTLAMVMIYLHFKFDLLKV